VKLREYREEDFETLCDIDWQCFPNGVAYTPREMRAFLRWATAIVVENRRGRVVAFLVSRRNRVVTLDVLPAYRRRGIASTLMAEFERRARQSGATKASLEVGVANRAALGLYRALGYRRIRRLPGYYQNGEDGWLMEKKLNVRSKA
jgi:ribosomal-protein-alanine N-acetyltransferase